MKDLKRVYEWVENVTFLEFEADGLVGELIRVNELIESYSAVFLMDDGTHKIEIIYKEDLDLIS